MTEVIDIHKVKGIRPEFDVYIGRKVPEFMDKDGITFPSKWGNRSYSLEAYEKHMRRKIKDFPEKYNLNELKGKRLGCWCITTKETEPLVCHGQVLMKLIRRDCNEV